MSNKPKNTDYVKEELTKDVNNRSIGQVLEAVGLKTVMGSGTPRPTEEVRLMVSPDKAWLREVADMILLAASTYDNHVHENLTVDILTEYLYWVILNRINYVDHGRNAVHPSAVSYPVMIYDALARIVRYDGATVDGSNVIPQVGERAISEEAQVVLGTWIQANTCPGATPHETPENWFDGERIIRFPYSETIVRYLTVAGVHMTMGLPMQRKETVRNFYEMEVCKEGYVTTAGKLPTIQETFARCFYEFAAIANLVGIQKVELVLYDVLRSKLYDVASSYVKNMRNHN